MKNDTHARDHWGSVYNAIPKSVFATLAWHLANAASGKADHDGAAVERFLEEIRILGDNEILPRSQVLAVVRAFEGGRVMKIGYARTSDESGVL